MNNRAVPKVSSKTFLSFQCILLGLLVGFLFLGIFPSQAEAGATTNLLKKIRAGLHPEWIRFVFDFETMPVYEVSSKEAELTLTFKETMRANQETSDKMLAQTKETKDVSFETLEVTEQEGKTEAKILLNYDAPYKIFSLEDPPRVVCDVQKIFKQEQTEEIADGVTHKTIYEGTFRGPVKSHLFTLDPKKVWFRPTLSLSDKPNSGFVKRPVSEWVKDEGALLAINGTYFDVFGRPLGALMIDQTLVSSPLMNRTALLFLNDHTLQMNPLSLTVTAKLPDGSTLPVHAVNAPRPKDQVILYNAAYGLNTRTNPSGVEFVIDEGTVKDIVKNNAPIPENPEKGFVLSAHGSQRETLLSKLKVGDPVEITYTFDPEIDRGKLHHIISGGPRLIKEGEIHVTSTEEKFKRDVAKGYAARTAIGTTQDGKFLIATVDGITRGSYYEKFYGKETRYLLRSIGMTLEQLATLMKDQGAYQAMNLDGGSSTILSLQGKTTNLPTTVTEKPVGNALLVYTQSPQKWTAASARIPTSLLAEKSRTKGGVAALTSSPNGVTPSSLPNEGSDNWRDDFFLWSESH